MDDSPPMSRRRSERRRTPIGHRYFVPALSVSLGTMPQRPSKVEETVRATDANYGVRLEGSISCPNHQQMVLADYSGRYPSRDFKAFPSLHLKSDPREPRWNWNSDGAPHSSQIEESQSTGTRSSNRSD